MNRMTWAAAIGLTLAAPGLAKAAPASGWNGTYIWEEALGRVGGNAPRESVAIFVTYTLTIAPGRCRLEAEGYQTFEHIDCVARPSPRGQALTIAFAGSADSGRPLRYTRGQPLLTLSRLNGRLVTQLQGLKDSQNRAARGTLFRRTR